MPRMKNKVFQLCCIALCCHYTLFSQQVTVAVAANVQFVMAELKNSFEKETGIHVNIVLGSSGKLTAQIREGAPYDVFISADTFYPLSLYRQHLAADSPRVYAQGVLVLWTARKDLHLSADLRLLRNVTIKKIALANPRLAPYGVAAEEALQKAGVFAAVNNKLVYGENIAQTNQYILSLAADAGFTAKSVVLADAMKGRGTWVEVDPASYSPIEQAAVLLRRGKEKNPGPSQQFYRFLYSGTAQSIFRKYGYLVN